ncbi:MAG: ribonuclease HII [Hyphomicrobiales bacterium]|nr:ribonuclease HII [Hyphomicrobiales bacterium]
MPPRQSDSPARADLPRPTSRLERRARQRGARIIAGVDEVGRGPLAGPVVVAAVVLEGRAPAGLDDSKRLSPAERVRLYDTILNRATVSVVIASRARVDRMNILQASLWAMARAVAGLAHRPDYVLVDGNMMPPGLCCPGEAVVRGDARSVSIAAASVVAKVTRDRLMAAVGRAYPHYGFDSHKGYSTRDHFAAIRQHGPCIHHRRSFAPIRIALGLEPEQIELFGDLDSESAVESATAG